MPIRFGNGFPNFRGKTSKKLWNTTHHLAIYKTWKYRLQTISGGKTKPGLNHGHGSEGSRVQGFKVSIKMVSTLDKTYTLHESNSSHLSCLSKMKVIFQPQMGVS